MFINSVVNTLRSQPLTTTTISTLFMLCEALLKRIGSELFTKLVKAMVLKYRCHHGYTFYSTAKDHWRFPLFEPKTTLLLEKLVRGDDVVVDVGAHVGIHTVHLAKRAAKVIAIEPEPFNLKLLRMNLKANKVDNKVIVVPVAASSYDGHINLHVSISSGLHTVEDKMFKDRRSLYTRTIKVPTRRIASILRKLDVEKVNVVKIDVEGHEEEVLKGMRELLVKAPPRILIVEVTNKQLINKLKEVYKYMVLLDAYGKVVNVAFISKHGVKAT